MFVGALILLLQGLNVIPCFVASPGVLMHTSVMLKGLKQRWCQTICVTTFRALKCSYSLKKMIMKNTIFLPSWSNPHMHLMCLLDWLKQMFCNVSTTKWRQLCRIAQDFILAHISLANPSDEFQLWNNYYWWWCNREEEQIPSRIRKVGR